MTSMLNMGERVDIEFDIPSRGIIGLRTNVLTASQGEAIMAHRFKEYQPYKGEISRRSNGSMIALETGTAYAYAIDKLQDRVSSSSTQVRRFTVARWLVSMFTTTTWWLM